MKSDDLASLLPIALVLIFAYLLLVRPARKRAREVSSLQTALSAGDEIMLTSGIFGRVTDVIDDKVTVEIAPDVVITVHRGAVGKIVRDVPADLGHLDDLDERSDFDDRPAVEETDDIRDIDDPGPTDPQRNQGAN